MAPLVLEGDTLGQKHRNYNKILANIKQYEIAPINYEDSDLDNLLKIDIACRNKDVTYVLKVFESEDLLYVSRVIKRSTWLITDAKYSYIINPKYLYDHLLPNMITKSFNKLLLHIRLNLKDEGRAEDFFKYYKQKDFHLALKWLPLCSIKQIEDIMERQGDYIPKRMLKRLFEKSFSCVEKYFSCGNADNKYNALKFARRYLKSDFDKYLILVETCYLYTIPNFGPKRTKLIMSKCPERVMTNLSRYSESFHAPAFAKFIKREDMRDFILRNITNSDIMRYWFTHNAIEPFVKRLPKKKQFKFIKEIFIDRKNKNISSDTIFFCCFGTFFLKRLAWEPTSEHIYCWYKYAPFDTAFVDLKKLIRSESRPSERLAMFVVLVICAGKDMGSIYTLLKYYRENHINEPFKFKIQFVNVVLTHTEPFKFDKRTWEYLNHFFNSMEVYSESKNSVQFCVRSIILYNIVHNESIPNIIHQKFEYFSYKKYQELLTEKEKKRLFSYVYKYLLTKIEILEVDKERECSEAVKLIKDVLNLIKDWKKELKDFPTILHKIKEIIRSKENNKWDLDLTVIFEIKKSWKKLFFSESILLNPTEKTCINALKHGLEILNKYKDKVEVIFLNQNAPFNFLNKVRIYWSESLANIYKGLFINKLDQKKVHEAALMGLCILLSRKELSNFLQEYTPLETKIDWSQPEDLEFSIRKHLAMKLYRARPQPSVTIALLYAKGDYLRYAHSSLNSIVYNTGSAKILEYLPLLMQGPFSLQKHAIRVAFAKLRYDELIQIVSDFWRSAKNKIIRKNIFNQSLNYLCRVKDEMIIKQMWYLLGTFIDNLTSRENKLVYINLSKVENVPMLIRPVYWMRVYKFLKSLSPQPNCDADSLVAHLISKISDIIDFLDEDFISEIFLESFEERFSTGNYEYTKLLTTYLLSTKTERAQIKRNKIILIPLLDRSLVIWDKAHNGYFYVQSNLHKIFSEIDFQFKHIVLNQKCLMPILLYTEILIKLQEKLTVTENYITITTRKLALESLKIFDKILNSNKALKALRESHESVSSSQWEQLYYESAPEIGHVSGKFLKEDIERYFPSLYAPFAEACEYIYKKYSFNTLNKIRILTSVIEFEEAEHFHLFVLKLLPFYGYHNELELKSELLEDISSHPSKHVKMYYWMVKYTHNRANVL